MMVYQIDHLFCLTFTQINEICSSLQIYIDKCHIDIQRQKRRLLFLFVYISISNNHIHLYHMLILQSDLVMPAISRGYVEIDRENLNALWIMMM